MIYREIDIQKIILITHLGYCEFLIMLFGATSPSSPYEFDESRTPQASPSERRIITMRAQPGVGFAAPWGLASSAVLHADFIV